MDGRNCVKVKALFGRAQPGDAGLVYTHGGAFPDGPSDVAVSNSGELEVKGWG